MSQTDDGRPDFVHVCFIDQVGPMLGNRVMFQQCDDDMNYHQGKRLKAAAVARRAEMEKYEEKRAND